MDSDDYNGYKKGYKVINRRGMYDSMERYCHERDTKYTQTGIDLCQWAWFSGPCKKTCGECGKNQNNSAKLVGPFGNIASVFVLKRLEKLDKLLL